MTSSPHRRRKLAVMRGAYGNLAALESCLADSSSTGADLKAFIGDAIGCCGHSDQVVNMIRSGFDLFVAGNHEQQAVAGSKSCGCGYSSADDERISCEAFELATTSLSGESRTWLSTWPDEAIVDMEGGANPALPRQSPGTPANSSTKRSWMICGWRHGSTGSVSGASSARTPGFRSSGVWETAVSRSTAVLSENRIMMEMRRFTTP